MTEEHEPKSDEQVLARLVDEERALSLERAHLHRQIDTLRGSSGTGDPIRRHPLEHLEKRERGVSARRRELHKRIEALGGPSLSRPPDDRRLP